MDSQGNSLKFRIYRLKDQDLKVAVPGEYWPQLDYELSQYGNLQNVPSERSIRGILIQPGNVVDELAQQNDIVINQLLPMS